MTLRWVDDDEIAVDTPSNRKEFYRKIKEKIARENPEAQERIENEIRAWLDNVSRGIADYASVQRDAGADWTGFERQTIYDATENWNYSRWWCGLLLMELAIAHPKRFMGYKPRDPGSEISTAYFLDRRPPPPN